jgi:hypothetical protein
MNYTMRSKKLKIWLISFNEKINLFSISTNKIIIIFFLFMKIYIIYHHYFGPSPPGPGVPGGHPSYVPPRICKWIV